MKANLTRTTIRICALIAITSVSACSVFGVNGVEEAMYEVSEQHDDIEIRDYAPMVVVETVVDEGFEEAGSTGFRRLFKYISGNNSGDTRIDMTAPVIQDPVQSPAGRKIDMTAPVIRESAGAGWRTQFVLPADITYESAPQPLDDQVAVMQIPPRQTAVIRFSGEWSMQSMQQKTLRLQGWIEDNGWQAVSEPRWAGYDPPWTLPMMRRNEVLIDIQRKP